MKYRSLRSKIQYDHDLRKYFDTHSKIAHTEGYRDSSTVMQLQLLEGKVN